MLNLEILNLKKMQMSGSKILDSIQNKSMPNIDLFVREAVQNSIDAFDKHQTSSEILININYDVFDFEALCNSLETIGESLSKKTNLTQKYLSFSDKNCIGLVGDLDPDKVSKFKDKKDQNLYNLVYDVLYKKIETNSGGSWGIGKTSFYRFGVGIIFYYSRIKINNRYESRLVGVLIENEHKTDCIINTSEYCGIAFLGAKKDDYTMPIVDDHQINRFLSIFNLDPYVEDETGTMLIIPFVDSNTFLPSLSKSSSTTIGLPWKRDLRKAFELSFQKWYFPRLNNRNVSPYLKVKYNGSEFESQNTLGFFKHLQIMYNTRANDNELYHVKEIEIKECGKVGRFIYSTLDEDQLGITPPNNQYSPYQYLGIDLDDDEIDSNKPIIMFTRKPGMIIDYKTIDRSWVSSKLVTTPDKFFIGLFVLESKDDLEAYFRASEKADHMDWVDIINFSNPRICEIQPFKLITSKIRKIQKAQIDNQQEPIQEESLKDLGKILANMLLPNEDFGDSPTIKNPSIGGGGGSTIGKSKAYKLVVENIFYEKHLNMHLKLQWKSSIKKVDIFFNVLSGSKVITINEWNEIGLSIPFRIEKIGIIVLQVGQNKSIQNNTFFFNTNDKYDLNDYFVLVPIFSNNGDVIGLSLINNKQQDMVIKIVLYLTVLDKSINIDLFHDVERGYTNE